MTRVTIEAASVDAALQLYFALNEICKNSDVRDAMRKHGLLENADKVLGIFEGRLDTARHCGDQL